MNSYYATITAPEGRRLLGGGKVQTSSRFESRRMAFDWLYAVMDGSTANRNATARVYGSTKPPEVKAAS